VNQPDHNQLNALLNLLDEPDEEAFALIRRRITYHGMAVEDVLQTTFDNSFDPLVRSRIESILKEIRDENIFIQFSNWLHVGSSDLLQGFILVTKANNPQLSDLDIISRIEQIKMDIWIELNEEMTAFESVSVINHLLFDIHHFKGNHEKISAIENSWVHTLLDQKKGSPLTLGILYLILAQKLGLPVYGVNLPQHFVLAYVDGKLADTPSEEDVLFYINPFNRGAVFTRREIELFIKQMKVTPQQSFFTPCHNSEIIKKLIHNIIFAYEQAGAPELSDCLETLLTAFE